MVDLTNKKVVEELVKACVKNDRNNQQIFYKMFYGKMLAVCMRYARNREEAKDIVHDGLIKVFSRLKSFENKGSLEGWVRRIIVNNAIDHVRAKKQEYFFEDENAFDNLCDDSNDYLEKEKLVQMKANKVLELIDQLSPAYKTVFTLYIVDNYTHQEIADKLGISVGTSKSNLAKAKMKIKELFEKNFKENE